MDPLSQWKKTHIVVVEEWIKAHHHNLDLENLLNEDNIERYLTSPSRLDIHGRELASTSVISQAPSRGVVIAPAVGEVRGEGVADTREKGKEKVLDREK